MKVQANTKKATKTIIKSIGEELQTALHGKTINEALKLGIIDDLGNDDGEFIFDHEDENISQQYAIVQGYGVIVSEGLTENLGDTDIFDCQFVKGISTVEGAGHGKPFFRLGMPQGLRLGASVKKLEVEPA